jgi:hypothetical protein
MKMCSYVSKVTEKNPNIAIIRKKTVWNSSNAKHLATVIAYMKALTESNP